MPKSREFQRCKSHLLKALSDQQKQEIVDDVNKLESHEAVTAYFLASPLFNEYREALRNKTEFQALFLAIQTSDQVRPVHLHWRRIVDRKRQKTRTINLESQRAAYRRYDEKRREKKRAYDRERQNDPVVAARKLADSKRRRQEKRAREQTVVTLDTTFLEDEADTC